MASPRAAVRPLARRTLGLQLFASAQDEPRSRRPTDVVLAIICALVVLVAAITSNLLAELEQSVAEVVADVPSFFDTLWRVAFWAPVAWSLVLIVAALVRGRRPLARDLIFAPGLSLVLAAVVAAIVMDDGTALSDLLFDVDGPPLFPPGLLVIATAMISTASPHLGRPFRNLGRWLIPFQLVGTIMLGAALPSGASAAIALGLFAAATIHLAVGSPGGRPTASRIRLALADLGVRVDDLAPASMQPEGVVLFDATDNEGPLIVKVYGRDAWDAQLLANLWRLVWYRGAERTARLSRVELVEHEAFVTLLAERAGAHVSHLVTAGSAGRSDALVVVRPLGPTIASALENAAPANAIDEAAVSGLWAEISRLHDAGITHGRIDLDRVLVTADGSLALGDLSSATVTGEPEDAAKDRAQVLTLSILLLGEDRGAAVARTFGDDRVVTVLPYLQEAAMPPLVRDELDRRKIDLDDVRTRLAGTLGADEQPLTKLRRVTWGSVINLALLALAAFAIITVFGDIDLESFVDALADASWWWLGMALVLAQLPRFPSAVSTMGAINRPLPFGPLATKEFALCYVNLAIPSSAARVAINVRFFRRFGVDATTAVSAGVIDSVSGFVVQIFLFLTLFFWSDVDFGITLDTSDLDGLLTIALIAVAVLIVLVGLVFLLPAWRHRALDILRKARAATAVLRNPTKVLQLFGGNLVSQVLFAVALSACVRAFGQELPLSTLVLINTVVTLFAGLLPIPGGMGVSEAGLTLGLTSAGVPNATAFAIAIAYRFTSFYLPPLWGYFCYRWLIKRRFL